MFLPLPSILLGTVKAFCLPHTSKICFASLPCENLVAITYRCRLCLGVFCMLCHKFVMENCMVAKLMQRSKHYFFLCPSKGQVNSCQIYTFWSLATLKTHSTRTIKITHTLFAYRLLGPPFLQIPFFHESHGFTNQNIDELFINHLGWSLDKQLCLFFVPVTFLHIIVVLSVSQNPTSPSVENSQALQPDETGWRNLGQVAWPCQTFPSLLHETCA